MAQSAGADEVRHARHAFRLAAFFSRKHIADVGGFPVEHVELAPSLDSFVDRTAEEGCRGESQAVARLIYAIGTLLPGSPVRTALHELLADETRHAALAWATVRWAVRRGARPPLQGASQQSETIPHRYATNETLPLSLTWAGRVPHDIATELAGLVDSVWVPSWSTTFEQNERLVALPRELPALPAGLVGDAVVQAARLVRSSLQSLEHEHFSSVQRFTV